MIQSSAEAPTTQEAESTIRFSQLASSLVESASYYASVRFDSARFRLRRQLLSLLPLFFAAVVVVSVIGVSSALLVLSVAIGTSQLFGQAWWIGGLATSLGLLACGGFALWFGLRRARTRELLYLLKKYENRRTQQRRRFGRELVQIHNG